MKLLHPFISFKQAIKPDVCEKIISLGLSTIKENKEKGISTDGTTLNEKHKKNDKIKKKKFSLNETVIRDSEICWLKNKYLYDLILPFIGKANKEAGWNWNIDTGEALQFTVYHGREKDGGFYGWHSDGSSDFNGAIRPAIKISDKPLRFKPPKIDPDGKLIKDINNQFIPDTDKEDLPLKKDGTGLVQIFSTDKEKWGKIRKISMT